MLRQIFGTTPVYYDDTEFELVERSKLRYIGSEKTIECPKNYTDALLLKNRDMTGLQFHNFIKSLIVNDCSGILDLRNTGFHSIHINSKIKVIIDNTPNPCNISLINIQDVVVDGTEEIKEIKCDDYPQKVLDLHCVRKIGILELKSDKLQVLDLSSIECIHFLTLNTPNLRYVKCFKSFHVEEVSINSNYIKQL